MDFAARLTSGTVGIVLNRPRLVLVAVALFPGPVPVAMVVCDCVGRTRQAQLAEIFRIQRETQPHLRRRVRSCCRSRPCRHACSGSWWSQLSWRLQRNVIL